ncbi:hypothetical protein H5410_023253 [Solanum commersonii]|uniref:Uncharacterized protein n=1 Tax=Solanum commersonii TaxID=4109 RepID=A0A9J5ZJC1_SOLCO|nr:hypothetical protein H5410_023253 [Solanum commersonii]
MVMTMGDIYEYSSSYDVEVYLIAYVEEIKPVPSEETWEVLIEILERKYLLHLLSQQGWKKRILAIAK